MDPPRLADFFQAASRVERQKRSIRLRGVSPASAAAVRSQLRRFHQLECQAWRSCMWNFILAPRIRKHSNISSLLSFDFRFSALRFSTRICNAAGCRGRALKAPLKTGSKQRRTGPVAGTAQAPDCHVLRPGGASLNLHSYSQDRRSPTQPNRL